MTDNDTAATEVTTTAPEGEAETTKEIDWKAEARKHEARAKENAAKAKANETAAQRLAEIESATKTAEEKANERVAVAEKLAAELEHRANVAVAANTAGIPVEILSGPVSSAPDDPNSYADSLIAWRGEQVSTRLTASREGHTPTKTVTDDHEFVRNLFGAVD